jgi:hypothetical protein
MIANSCGAATCSAFNELKNESQWYGHNLLPQGNSVRKEASRTEFRKYDFDTAAHNSVNVLRNAQEINSTLSNADFSMSLISGECWQHDSSIVDISLASQTVHGTDKMSVTNLYPREGDELSSRNCATDFRMVKFDASSEINTHFTCNQDIEHNFQHHCTTGSGSVEIKVEVDPNLYVNCETSVDGDSWSDSHLKTTQCNKSSIMLLSKTHSCGNIKQNVSVNTLDAKDLDITNNRFNIANRQGQITESDNMKLFLEDELDDRQKRLDSEESESEVSELSEDDSDFCAETPQVEEYSGSFDFMRNGNSEEQLDIQLSGFYRFECDECAKKQTFSNFNLLVQHCRDQHQTKGCVSCCGQTIWERNELVKHMLDHKHTYR